MNTTIYRTQVNVIYILMYLLCIGCLFNCNQSNNGKKILDDHNTMAMSNTDLKKEFDFSIFPKANEGQKRYFIQVDQQSDEQNYKVELIPGKIMEVDCNKHSLNGIMHAEVLKGWGYQYYTFETNGNVMQTRMACPDAKKEEKFVSSKGRMIRYNSKLPIVLYAPDGYEVRYKIWSGIEMKESSELCEK